MRPVEFIQHCADQNSGAEAAIDAMHDIFDETKTEAD